MNDSNDQFRSRRERTSSDGIERRPERPSVTGIKIDPLDISQLDLGDFKSAELGKKDLAKKMLGDASSGVKIEVDDNNLAKLENSIKDIHKQQQNQQVRAL